MGAAYGILRHKSRSHRNWSLDLVTVRNGVPTIITNSKANWVAGLPNSRAHLGAVSVTADEAEEAGRLAAKAFGMVWGGFL